MSVLGSAPDPFPHDDGLEPEPGRKQLQPGAWPYRLTVAGAVTLIGLFAAAVASVLVWSIVELWRSII